MPVTYAEVYAVLSPEEPDYAKAAQLGAEALPHLEAMIGGKDVMLASKAAYAAGLVGGERATALLRQAAGHREAALRVAAASAVARLPSARAAPILEALLSDRDLGVRKVALRSIPADAPASLRRKVAEIAAQSSPLQQISAEVLGKLKP